MNSYNVSTTFHGINMVCHFFSGFIKPKFTTSKLKYVSFKKCDDKNILLIFLSTVSYFGSKFIVLLCFSSSRVAKVVYFCMTGVTLLGVERGQSVIMHGPQSKASQRSGWELVSYNRQT